MDMRSMQRMMQQMGIRSEEIKAKRVVIETDAAQIVISAPQVVAITMQGQKTFQVSGTVEENAPSPDDVAMVMQQTGAVREAAEAALKETNGDIAEAILKLKG
jgi:nascent polypeptide-associated complex subunit alpha